MVGFEIRIKLRNWKGYNNTGSYKLVVRVTPAMMEQNLVLDYGWCVRCRSTIGIIPALYHGYILAAWLLPSVSLDFQNPLGPIPSSSNELCGVGCRRNFRVTGTIIVPIIVSCQRYTYRCRGKKVEVESRSILTSFRFRCPSPTISMMNHVSTLISRLGFVCSGW
jgi:hypothetical protein